jgi:hypothetical protein
MAFSEKEILVRAHVKEMKKFYTHLSLYTSINVGLSLIWAISGGGYFWPIWVIVGWGIGILMEALSLNMIPSLGNFFPFLGSDWEETQVQKLLMEEETRNEIAPKEKRISKIQ